MTTFIATTLEINRILSKPKAMIFDLGKKETVVFVKQEDYTDFEQAANFVLGPWRNDKDSPWWPEDEDNYPELEDLCPAVIPLDVDGIYFIDSIIRKGDVIITHSYEELVNKVK